ncbi:MAG: MmgE/PrpD family protein [Thermodesulfobacteriota bacterium]
MAKKILDNLVEYMLASKEAKIPEEVLQRGKSHILDSLAAVVSGSRLKAGRLGIQYAREQGVKGECGVLGSDMRTTPITAAFANGLSAHADETDDSNSQLHPGCAIVPAAWAAGEWQNRNGEALLRAVILGYDVAMGFHKAFEIRSTSFGATFGAAAAAGTLAQLDSRQLCYLISYAGQQASGSRAWVGDDEHVEKAFDFGGMPARNGVTPALLVKSGFTGNRDLLEGDRNIVRDYVPCDPQKLLAGLGQQYTITRCLIKKYPVGSPMMEAVDAMLRIVTEHKVKPQDVVKVIARIPGSARTVNNREMPDVNVQYILSAILLDGKLTFEAAHDYERFQDKKLREMKEKVQLIVDEELQQRTGKRYQALLEVTLKDGRTVQEHVIDCRGRPDNPMNPEEVGKKAAWLMEPVIGVKHTQKIMESIGKLESVSSIRNLTDLLMLA